VRTGGDDDVSAGKARRGAPRRYDWSGVDWSERDVDIAARLGCSREAVRRMRGASGKPPSPLKHRRAATVATVRYLRDRPDVAAGARDVDLAGRPGLLRDPNRVSAVRRALGIGKAPGHLCTRFPWTLVNWDLSNADLARVWRVHRQTPAQTRYQKKMPAARWPAYIGRERGDGYRESLAAERVKAKAWRAGRP
jgi:hypothetical protein